MEIIGTRSSGYQYFISLDTREQVGDSVMVCYIGQASLAQWVAYAEAERALQSVRDAEAALDAQYAAEEAELRRKRKATNLTQ